MRSRLWWGCWLWRVRGGCGFWWWRSFLWVRGVVLGGGAFPLVVGWVGGNDFPSVASRVGWGLSSGVDNKGGGVGWLVSRFWLGVVVGVGWVFVVGFGLVWLVVGCGGCWGWVFFVLFCLLFFGVFFVLFCLLFFGVFLLCFVCFGVGWWVGGGVVGCVGLSVGAGCCLVCGWGVVGGLGWCLCCVCVGWGCGLGFSVWGSAGCVLVVLGEWHGVWCLLPCCLDVVGAVVGGVSAACAVGVGVWVGRGLVGVGVGAWWWVLIKVCGVCVFFVEEGGGLGGCLGGADLLPFVVVEAAGGVECAVDCCCGADGWGVVGVGCECCGGVHEGVGLLVLCLLGWWCGVVPVLKWALEEDEGLGVGCGEPVVGWLCVVGCVLLPVGEVADGVCWRGEWCR